MASEELLHGGLLEVALLGDEPRQPVQQRIDIAQRRRDGVLFREGRESDDKIPHVANIEMLLRKTPLIAKYLLFAK